MTTIGSTSYFTSANRLASVARPASGTGFADQMASEATASSGAQSGKLADLLSQLEELQKQQLQMSNRDYLSAKLGLQEQISSARLNAGEDLDVIGVQFEGRVYQLAGKRLDLASLKVASPPQIEMVQPAKPGNLARGFDIRA